MPTRISLIRHGETAWNVNGRWQGHAAVPLNDEGLRTDFTPNVSAEISMVF